MIAGERQGAAPALFLEIIAHGGELLYRLAPDGSRYQIGLIFPDGLDAEAEDRLWERVLRHRARLLAMVLVTDEDAAAVLREARYGRS